MPRHFHPRLCMGGMDEWQVEIKPLKRINTFMTTIGHDKYSSQDYFSGGTAHEYKQRLPRQDQPAMRRRRLRFQAQLQSLLEKQLKRNIVKALEGSTKPKGAA